MDSKPVPQELHRKLFAASPEVRSATSRAVTSKSAGAARALASRSLTEDSPSPSSRGSRVRPADAPSSPQGSGPFTPNEITSALQRRHSREWNRQGDTSSSPMPQQGCGPLTPVEVRSALQRRHSREWNRQSSPPGHPGSPHGPVEIRSAIERRQGSKMLDDANPACNSMTSVDFLNQKASDDLGRRPSMESHRPFSFNDGRRTSKEALIAERKRQRSISSQSSVHGRLPSKEIKYDLEKEEKAGSWPTLPRTDPTDKYYVYLDQGHDQGSPQSSHTENAESPEAHADKDGLLGARSSPDEFVEEKEPDRSLSIPVQPMETIISGLALPRHSSEVPSINSNEANSDSSERPATLPASTSMIGLPDYRSPGPKRSLPGLLIGFRELMSPLRKSVDLKTPVRPFSNTPNTGQSAVAYDNMNSLLPVAPLNEDASRSDSFGSQDTIPRRRSVRQSLSNVKQKFARIWHKSR